MLDVYEKLNHNNNSTEIYEPYIPAEIVTIALGTNDLSHGDGTKPRKSFDKNQFVQNYISLIKKIFDRNSKTKIILLDSPMVHEPEITQMHEALNEIQGNFDSTKYKNQISQFHFTPFQATGCTGHPIISEDLKMGEELSEYLSKLLQ